MIELYKNSPFRTWAFIWDNNPDTRIAFIRLGNTYQTFSTSSGQPVALPVDY